MQVRTDAKTSVGHTLKLIFAGVVCAGCGWAGMAYNDRTHQQELASTRLRLPDSEIALTGVANADFATAKAQCRSMSELADGRRDIPSIARESVEACSDALAREGSYKARGLVISAEGAMRRFAIR